MNYMYWALGALGLAYGLWIHFLAVMNLLEARRAGTLTKTAERLGMPVALVGYIADVLAQFTVAVIFFVELPKEITVSARVKRWVEGPPLLGYLSGPPTKGLNGWRYSLALWLRVNLLKPFDRSGGHG
jgi:hypothetical protein